MKLGEENISIYNIWRKFESCSVLMPNLHMSELYMEIKQSLLTCLRFYSACSCTHQQIIRSWNPTNLYQQEISKKPDLTLDGFFLTCDVMFGSVLETTYLLSTVRSRQVLEIIVACYFARQLSKSFTP